MKRLPIPVVCGVLITLMASSGPAPAGDLIFQDGFETGDASRWSSAIGLCIASGTDADVQAALTDVGSVAVLCPGAVFQLQQTVFFTASDQEIRSEGLPTDSSRALLRVDHPDVATAVDAGNNSRVKLRHVTIDGNRPELGIAEGGLIEFGGAASDQLVEGVKAYEPRGWSVLVVTEGEGLACTGAVVRDNQLGPAGRAEYIIADGISLACRDSTVTGNTIVDATDGGIVIFQAPGSLVQNNEIRSDNRILFYGISMVDYGPFDGDFTDTLVIGNTLEARGALMRHGIDMGTYVGCGPAGAERNSGATVQGNTLLGDFMGYGYVVAGVEDWTVTANVDLSTHLAPVGEHECLGAAVDPPAGFQLIAASSQGTFQPEFQDSVLDFAERLWPLQPVADAQCVSDLIGATLFEEIKDGLHGPLWPALEAAPNGELVDGCVSRFDPPAPAAGGAGVIVAVDACTPYCAEVSLTNAGTTSISLTDLVLVLESFVTACPGLPAALDPEEEVTCIVDDYVTDGFQVLWWYGLSPPPNNSWGFEYPFPITRTRSP